LPRVPALQDEKAAVTRTAAFAARSAVLLRPGSRREQRRGWVRCPEAFPQEPRAEGRRRRRRDGVFGRSVRLRIERYTTPV